MSRARPSADELRRRRRQHHRDLPAKVRRRQAIAVGVIGAVVVGGVYFAFLKGEEENPLAKVPIEELAGQTVVGKVGKGGPSRDTLRRVTRGQLGGVILEPQNERSATRDTAELQKAAKAGDRPPLLIMIDQEGAPVKRLPDGPPQIAPRDMADRGGADTAKREGTDTGRFLERLGINVDLAPVLDVPQAASPESISARTFGTDPDEVAELGTAFAQGLAEGGVGATAKHFPGLGQSLANPDDEKSTVKASRDDLDADLEPFKSAIDAGVPLVMTSNAIYPAFGSNDPAAWSPSITRDLLRDELGFDGAIITDDLESAAVKAAAGSPDRAAVRVLQNGGDLVLFALSEGGSAKGYKTVVKAARKGKLERPALEDAYEHVIDLKHALAAD